MGTGPTSRRLATVAGVGVLAALLAGACAPPPDEPLPVWDFVEGEPSRWVTIYDPRKAWNGYTLAFYRQRIPILLDMNGGIVHAWPEARVRTRMRLLDNGNLLAVSLSKGVTELSWEGEEVWSFQPPQGFVHHDVIRLANGNTMMLVQERGGIDDVIEVDRSGAIVWRWKARRQMKRFLPPGTRGGDVLHLNSVQELPANHWFDGGDERFRPGNLLFSARNLDLLAIVDRASGQPVWSWPPQSEPGRSSNGRLDRQHEALMIPKGQPGAGNIQVFNNRYRSFLGDRRSEVVEIDPVSGEVTWSFSDETLHSPTSALEQPLPNGNVLIASSRGGRVFEVDRDGDIVWQWTPPFDPVRPSRYAPDHCPQLSRVARRRQRAVEPPEGYRYVDQDVYRLARGDDLRRERIFRRKRQVMAANDFCGAVLVPWRPTMTVEYGLDGRRMKAAGLIGETVHFALTWTPDGDTAVGEAPVILLEDTMTRREKPPWRSRTLPMEQWALRRGELCLETEVVDTPAMETESFAFWSMPTLTSGQKDEAHWTTESTPLTEEEAEVRRQHLETLGYVD